MINDAYCSPDDLDTAISTYNRLGFVVLRGAVPDEDLDLIEAELTAAPRWRRRPLSVRRRCSRSARAGAPPAEAWRPCAMPGEHHAS